MQAKTFKALGILLCYPDERLCEGASDLYSLIEKEAVVAKDRLSALRELTDRIASEDLFSLQEEYVDTFDRVRSLSLHLFEHVHGDSRDRGQAMVDLSERYKEQGFVLAASELPDYLPVFLEYLSVLPKDQAFEELAETGHILAALGKRLAERGNIYTGVLDTLIVLAGRVPEKVERKEKIVIDFEQIDKEWEEKPVQFLGADAPNSGGGCSSGACGGCSDKIQQSVAQGA